MKSITPFNIDYSVLSFVFNHSEISEVIPGMRNLLQARLNTKTPIKISNDDL